MVSSGALMSGRLRRHASRAMSLSDGLSAAAAGARLPPSRDRPRACCPWPRRAPRLTHAQLARRRPSWRWRSSSNRHFESVLASSATATTVAVFSLSFADSLADAFAVTAAGAVSESAAALSVFSAFSALVADLSFAAIAGAVSVAWAVSWRAPPAESLPQQPVPRARRRPRLVPSQRRWAQECPLVRPRRPEPSQRVVLRGGVRRRSRGIRGRAEPVAARRRRAVAPASSRG